MENTTLLPPKLTAALRQLFASYPEIDAVFLYGSRGQGNIHRHSDIDLALTAPQLSAADFARLQYQIRFELPTLIPAEIARLEGAAADFSTRIRQKGVIIYAGHHPTEVSAYVGSV